MSGAEVRVYSRATDGETAVSPNFKAREFACRDGSDAIFISERLLDILQTVRNHFGKLVTINSAYRTPTHNANEGGAAQSQHLYGTAADIVVSGVPASEVADYAELILPGTGGVGRYAGFTHIDVRETMSRWNG